MNPLLRFRFGTGLTILLVIAAIIVGLTLGALAALIAAAIVTGRFSLAILAFAFGHG